MDQFVTTYRKDYLWPYIRSLGKKLIESVPRGSGFEGTKCTCKCYSPDAGVVHSKRPVLAELETQDWSRVAPMGALIDPKLYPVKFGKAPETDTMRLDQPNMFLKKLQEKYPNLYEIIEKTPDVDLISKVIRDRLRTTYQVDFCKMEEYPPDDLLRASGVDGVGPCPQTVKLPADMYRPVQKSIARRPAVISKMAQTGRKDKGADQEEGGLGIWSFNKTEYQDNISKLGDSIIKDKIHHQRHNKFY